MDKDRRRPGRCWYCGEEELREGDPPEHVIPDAMGGRLKTDRVCARCNGLAGKAIDGPFMHDPLIAMARVLHSPRGGRMQARSEATLGDGTPVDLKTGKGPWKATVRATIEREGDEIFIRAANRAEYEKLFERARREVEAEGRELANPGEPTEVEDSGMVIVRAKVSGLIWLRMAAKVTLGCLSKVLDDDWLDTADAVKYRSWLWDQAPVNEDGSPARGLPVEPDPFELHVLRAPEHLLYFAPARGDRAILTMAFFGSLLLRTRVELDGRRPPRLAWRTAPGAPASETTFDALLAEMTKAVAEELGED
jgi:hypothetical protein